MKGIPTIGMCCTTENRLATKSENEIKHCLVNSRKQWVPKNFSQTRGERRIPSKNQPTRVSTRVLFLVAQKGTIWNEETPNN